ncbi:MAG: hypothetical protein LBP35_01020 [Candidatus Ancillula trichonymphae]|nr:hypothetical protein [Candidatus Ancillula trichonymphae]
MRSHKLLPVKCAHKNCGCAADRAKRFKGVLAGVVSLAVVVAVSICVPRLAYAESSAPEAAAEKLAQSDEQQSDEPTSETDEADYLKHLNESSATPHEDLAKSTETPHEPSAESPSSSTQQPKLASASTTLGGGRPLPR